MRLRSRISLQLALLLLALAPVTATSSATALPTQPTVLRKDGSAAVGALFSLNADGSLGEHFCTSTVVDSTSGDLVLTAAHCLSGLTPGSFAFVPGYRNGTVPLGIWIVDNIYVDDAWSSSHDADDDFAFLAVAQTGLRSLEAETGSDRLGVSAMPGELTTVTGYPDSSDQPISCQNDLLAYSATQLQFDCGGYTNGTSGSALLIDSDPTTGRGTIVGVIGGYQQGGDTPSTSYAAAFGSSIEALYQQVLAADGSAAVGMAGG
jgi:V8-like Glu-specific endopeptidase